MYLFWCEVDGGLPRVRLIEVIAVVTNLKTGVNEKRSGNGTDFSNFAFQSSR